MNKYILSFFLVICLAACDKNKHQQSDEYAKDSLSVFLENSYDEALPYKVRHQNAGKALSLISKRPNDTTKRFYYFKIANRYYNMGAWPEYLSLTKSIIKFSEDAKDTARLATAYTYMTDYYSNVKNDDSLYSYNYKAEKLFRRLKDNGGVAKTLLSKAILQHNAGDFLGAERTVFEMLNFLRDKDDTAMSYEANNLLGIVYGELQEYDLSRKYYDLALELAISGHMPSEYQLAAATYNNLGFLYLNQKDYRKAREYFLFGLQQKKLLQDQPLCYATLYDNLGYANFKLGDLKQLPDLFNRSIRIKDSIKAFNTQIGTQNHLSEYYAFLADTTKAIEFAKKGCKIAQASKQKRELLSALRQLTAVDRLHSNKYSVQYYKIRDSLDVSERKAQNRFARIEYETDQLAQDKVQLVEQRKTLIYIALGIILIAVFVFVIRIQISKNRELRLIQEQQKANEEIYSLMISQQEKVEESRQAEKKRIAQELHDGVLGKLFGTRMNLGVLNTRKDEDGIVQRVGYIDELKNLEQEIREISHDLNSEKTAVFNNFVLMVTNFIETQRTVCQADIVMNMDTAIEWNAVANTAKINLYRILQEAFQNINKHANAQNVHVTFEKKNSLIQLEVRDDGVGFIYSKKRNGIGLQNMLSRITTSGGTMDIITKPGEGTTLHFELPLT